ncbi:DNA alkylation repair protein [Mycolicibacterium sp. CH28]|uniref:DNA alkylation repair protein n=1 Tax=Mycolicibacterium sp. CH28 TaxID=2512237 RepID=UPI001082259F|nr:DNA alkylation repair protein [Mycolicibacterium sp. CH28]TGD84566.1 DNA alkylation repair protein [Mycolicibacterium sp. CH28]
MPTADELLNPRTVEGLADCLARAHVGPVPRLLACRTELSGLRFSERVGLIRDALLSDLPADFDSFAALLRSALDDEEFAGWMIFPVTEAVAVRGIEFVEPALGLLADLTPRLTAETAVRPFLRVAQDRTLSVAQSWTRHPDAHVRRLASESTRPRLPWAVRVPGLTADPRPTLPILDALYRDESEYVRRSVANHLNDISHDHPDLAVAVATRWLDNPGVHTGWVLRHGLRTLVKKGHPGALGLFGYSADTPVRVAGPVVRTELVAIGESLEFDCTITNTGQRPAAYLVDYCLHFLRANGSHGAKVFKLSKHILEPGAEWSIVRRHSFAPITTRRYYPGTHYLQIQVNGVSYPRAKFGLTVGDSLRRA